MPERSFVSLIIMELFLQPWAADVHMNTNRLMQTTILFCFVSLGLFGWLVFVVVVAVADFVVAVAYFAYFWSCCHSIPPTPKVGQNV